MLELVMLMPLESALDAHLSYTDQIYFLYFGKKLLRCVTIFKAKKFVNRFTIEDVLVVILFLFSSQKS